MKPRPFHIPTHSEAIALRFWAKVEKHGPSECWLWAKGKHKNGYGQFSLGHLNLLAHRVAYELSVGPIPENYYLDHLCRVRDCVNPTHLEPVTLGQNVLRGVGITALNALKTHCNHGHPFNEENTRITSEGDRECVSCRRDILHRFRNNQKRKV